MPEMLPCRAHLRRRIAECFGVVDAPSDASAPLPAWIDFEEIHYRLQQDPAVGRRLLAAIHSFSQRQNNNRKVPVTTDASEETHAQ